MTKKILDQGVHFKMKKTVGLFGAAYQTKAKDILSERFTVPPFSVLNTREGFWQARKQQWISIGIKSELGRGENLLKYSDTILEARRGGKPFAVTYDSGAPGDLSKSMKRKSLIRPSPGRGLAIRTDGGIDEYREKGRKLRGGNLNIRDIAFTKKVRGGLAREAGPQGEGKSVYLHPTGENEDEVLGGTSIFDPVLCELVYRWFARVGARVLDPFAGGSVRGIIAGELGLQYHGVDLSGRQLEANRQQAKTIGTRPEPLWVEGDSIDAGEFFPRKDFDLLFSCPPYGDLEKYSDDERDLSALSVADFDHKYANIIAVCCSLLKDNAFACFVVGDYRNSDGFYQNLPAKTVAAFEDAGLHLYNEIILINATGSLPLRINAQFTGSRKVGKCHQNVLIFAKGQPKEFVKSWTVNLNGEGQ